jgi:3-hydroxyisobutyrate dehydrogenase-like beta-hydroxyacid dehydrogenase
MADRILGAGYRLVVYDIRPEALLPFEGRAEIATSPRDAASKSDIVFACLVTAESFRDILFGPSGVIHGGRARTYVHLGTSGGPLLREITGRLGAIDIGTVDGPITGGVLRAGAGTLTAIVAGPATLIERVAPIMQAYAQKIVCLGTMPGAAQIMKLVNNMISLGNLAIAAEALVVGARGGLDPETMIEVLNSGSGQNSATLTKIPQAILPRTFDFGGSLAVEVKDLTAFVEEATDNSVSSPLGQAILETYAKAMCLGSPTDDLTTVIRHMENAAGVLVQRMPK